MTDWQWTFGGLTFGDGTDIDVIEHEGWDDLPDIESRDVPRGGRHGLHAGLDLARTKVYRFDLELIAGDDDALEALLGEMRAAFVVQEVERELVGTLPGQPTKRAMVRCRRRRIPTTLRRLLRYPTVAVELVATDPRIYAAAESSGSTGFPSGGTGRTYPRTYPRVYGAAGTGGVVSAENAGSVAVPWQAQITGPWTNPTITHVGLGLTLTINVTLDAGQTLNIDSGERSILLGGTASRYGSLVQPASWFDLEPGSNEIRFGGAAGSGGAVLSWRSGWM